MDDPVYVLDANVFIEAARRYYAFDLAPGFWQGLIDYGEDGQVESIDRVKHELARGKDQLAAWANSNFSDAFVSTDRTEVIRGYADIIAWVESQAQYSDAAKANFASGADGWLVAYASIEGRVVVTQEVPAPDARRKVPIPNVCDTFSVTFVDTFEMLRTLGIRFT